jgi:hypothetical protein
MTTIIDTTIVTYHGAQRAKERQNLKNPRSVDKNVRLARARGKRAEDCASWERSFLIQESQDDCTAVAYQDFCYIFNSKGACVTLYPLPVWFGKKKAFHGKERIRNYRRFCRDYTDFTMREILN